MERMYGSTFVLAIGVMFLAVVRFSADPAALSVVAVLGILFVATGCALHTAAILHELAFLSPLVRGLATAVGWVAWTIAVVFGCCASLTRAPRSRWQSC